MSLLKTQKVFGDTRTIGFLLYSMDEGDMNLDPDYQREYVWEQIEQQSLLYSIFNQMPFGSIAIIEKSITTLGPHIELVDGKQRVTTIYKFYKNEIPYISEDGTEIFFKDMDITDQRSFKQISFTINILSGDISEVDKYRYFYTVNFSGKEQSESHRKLIVDKIVALSGMT